jgi:hypothetical protein
MCDSGGGPLDTLSLIQWINEELENEKSEKKLDAK